MPTVAGAKNALVLSHAMSKTTPTSSALNYFAPVGFNPAMAAAMPGGLASPTGGAWQTNTSSGYQTAVPPVVPKVDTPKVDPIKPPTPDPVIPTGPSDAMKDAYAILELEFKRYGLDELIPIIEGYMKNNIGVNQAALMIRNEKAYLTRFAGNTQRVAAGLNALPENQYLLLENSYMETLAGYGLKSYFGTDRASMTANMANIIGGDVSATEFATRVKTVSDNVTYGDPQIKQQLKNFYNLSDADLMSYYLDPKKNNLAQLLDKTATAQIGAAAANQGLATNVTSASALARQGVTQAQAQTGYATIGQEMPIASKLSQIYGKQGAGVNQADLEANQFNTIGAASAARKRQQIIDLEKGSFSGRSGIVGSSSQAGYTGSLGKALQGKF